MPFIHDSQHLSRLREHAARRGFAAPGLAAPERLARAKAFLALESRFQRRMHRRGAGGITVVRERADMVDVLLESLWARATEDLGGIGPGEAALVALGGYGRAELCPHSDLDILLLYSPRLPQARLERLRTALTDAILYPLWDMGFKVGHASRDIRETIEAARADILTKVALLETRLVAGDPALYSDLKLTLAAEFRTPGFVRDTVRHLLDEQDRRREKHGDSVFVQEPEVKNGVGGLRDLHTLVWLGRIRSGTVDLNELALRGHLRADDAAKLNECRSFLLRVRNELHYISPRPTDILTLEKQPVVAANLGYDEEDWVRRVERFMRDYYAAADFIIRTVREAEWFLERPAAGKRFDLSSPAEAIGRAVFSTDAFDIADGRINAQRDTVFDEDPVRLLCVFRHAQRHGVQISAELVRLIREKAALFTYRHACEPRSHQAFLSILSESGRVYPALSAMRDLGVLTRYMPEFAGMICLVQHELYHRYTADIHTLLCIRELDMIFSGETPASDAYREALFELEDPGLLYLILLLHDIGKPLGIKGHAETGVHVAAPFLDRLGVKGERRALVEKIIRAHLDMSAFWQRHDVDDPDMIARFATRIGDPDTLRLLYIHTFCDARATTQGLWNGYKDSLHSALYRGSLAKLEGRDESAAEADTEAARLAHLAAYDDTDAAPVSREAFAAHLALSNARYLRRIDTATALRHATVVDRMLTHANTGTTESLLPAIEWDDNPDTGLATVTLASWDRPGLFFRVCGAFAGCSLSIHVTYAFSRADGIALDVFYVTEADGGTPRPAKRDAFLKHLRAILVEEADPAAIIARQTGAKTSKRDALRRPREPKVAFEYDRRLGRTVLEIRASDRLGLLYELGEVLFRHRRDIVFARIATESGYARDTFYLSAFPGENPESVTDDEAMRRDLMKVIAE